MKKVLITMAVLASMVAGAMVLSSFTAPKQISKDEMCNGLNIPSYWEGLARNKANYDCGLYITVYQTPNLCNDYYAIITDTKCSSGTIGKELVVKVNYNYDSESKYWYNHCRYYVTSGTSDYYFDM